MLHTPTPHIAAKPGDFGKTVLMPGDPLRAKFIAENFFEKMKPNYYEDWDDNRGVRLNEKDRK